MLERVNVPGTVQSSNWSYRLMPNIEDLVEHKDLQVAIGRTLNPSDKAPTPHLAERKPTIYVC